jgi:hypothetical protein
MNRGASAGCTSRCPAWPSARDRHLEAPLKRRVLPPQKEMYMAAHVIVVMSPPGEASPGDQGRMVHAMTLARDLRAAGQQVSVYFHGVGARWLAAMADRNDPFTRHYGPLFDQIRDVAAGCEFCVTNRFGAAEGASRLGVRLVGGLEEHHSVAAQLVQGDQLHAF